MEETKLNKYEYIILIFLALSASLYYFSYYDRGLNLLDGGYLLDAVMKVREGAVPYRDFHHFYAPGSFYLFALLFGLTGPDYAAVNLTWASLHVLAGVVSYLATRKFAKPLYALGAAIIVIIGPGAWLKSFFTVSPLVIAWLVFRYIDRPSFSRAFMAGVVSGLLFAFRQDVPIYAFVAFFALYLWTKFGEKEDVPVSRLGAFVLGIILMVGPFLLFFAVQGALVPLVDDLFIAGNRGTSANSLQFPPFFNLWSGSLLKTLADRIYLLPFFIYGATLALLIWSALRRKDFPGRLHLCFMTFFGILILFQVKNRSDLSHLWQVMPPVIITTTGFFSAAETVFNRSFFLKTTFLLIICWSAAVALTNQATGSIALMNENRSLLDEPRARVYMPEPNAKGLKDALSFLRENDRGGHEDLLVVPDAPLIYFLLNKRNPVKYSLFRLGGTSFPSVQREIIMDLESKNIKWIVYNNWEMNDGKVERTFYYHSPILNGFILRNFAPVHSSDNYTIMKRKSGNSLSFK